MSTTNATTNTTTFKVGDKATFIIYTDRVAGYITYVSPNGKTVKFQEAEAKLLNGFNSGEADALVMTPGGFRGHTSGEQRWEIAATPKPDCGTRTCTLRPNGKWKQAGRSTNTQGARLIAGHSHFYDYNF